MTSLTWNEVWGRRLARHRLLVPETPERLVEVVRSTCGIHAQVMSAAEASIGIRVRNITRQDVRAALWEQRSLVKIYGLRGTVHLFPADELPLWIAALRANPKPKEDQRLTQLGLEPRQRDVVVEGIGEALDGRCLTRDELGAEVARLVGSWALDEVSPAFGGHLPRWQMALGAATLAGRLCFGPNQGSKVTFVRPDQWLGGWTEIDGATALREVFLRYLSTYGPATPRDFAQWFTMPPGAAQDLARQLAGELEEVDVEGYSAWMPAKEAAAGWAPVHDVVHLLPHFDCYVIGCHPRDRLVPPAYAAEALTQGSAGNLPTVLVNGTVAGRWQHRRKGKRLEVRVNMFERPSPSQSGALEAAATRIGEIMEAEPSLSLERFEPRPHL